MYKMCVSYLSILCWTYPTYTRFVFSSTLPPTGLKPSFVTPFLAIIVQTTFAMCLCVLPFHFSYITSTRFVCYIYPLCNKPFLYMIWWGPPFNFFVINLTFFLPSWRPIPPIIISRYFVKKEFNEALVMGFYMLCAYIMCKNWNCQNL